jgi:hypothetical protein
MLKYVRNLLVLQLILLDFALNTVLGGSPLETVSRRGGRIKIAAGGKIPRKRFFMRFVEWLTNLIDKNHLLESADARIGDMGVVDTAAQLQEKYGC